MADGARLVCLGKPHSIVQVFMLKVEGIENQTAELKKMRYLWYYAMPDWYCKPVVGHLVSTATAGGSNQKTIDKPPDGMSEVM